MIRNVLVVEDKQVHMDAVCNLLADLDIRVNVFRAYSLDEAILLSKENVIHVFLVDIILDAGDPGDVSGLKFIQMLRNDRKYEFTPVIILTSLVDPKLYAYSDLHCYGYLEKPYDKDKLTDLIHKALGYPLPETKEQLFYRKDGIIFSVNIKDIVYLTVSRRRLTIHTRQETIKLPNKTMEAIMQELASKDFIICNRFDIVNRSYISSVDYTNRMIHLYGTKDILEIGPVMVKKFREEYGHD